MRFRSPLVVLLPLLFAAATLTASTTYSFGTIPFTTSPAFGGLSLAAETTAYSTSEYSGVWAEDFTGGAGTTEQIVCAVALTTTTNTCGSGGGNFGPGSAHNIGIPAAPGNTVILPGWVTNYMEVDGDNTYGAPVWTNMTGLTVGGEYELSFYQASNEENGNNKVYDDQWQVFIISGANQEQYQCPTCGTPVNNLGAPTFSAPSMHNAGARATDWELETYTFIALSASETLEFVTNAVSTAGGSFMPPFLDLAGVSTQAVPEPATWVVSLIGVAVVMVASRLRRRHSAEHKRVIGE